MAYENRWRAALEYLTGGRTTAIINLCALGMAVIVTAETVFIMRRILGMVNPSDYYATLVPIGIMLLVRRKVFSIIFALLYFVLLVETSYEWWMIYVGTPLRYPGKSLGTPQATMVILTVIGFGIHIVIAVLRFIFLLLTGEQEE
jgi:hypothetical protein